jgi:hypothetical protein
MKSMCNYSQYKHTLSIQENKTQCLSHSSEVIYWQMYKYNITPAQNYYNISIQVYVQNVHWIFERKCGLSFRGLDMKEITAESNL